MAKILECHSKGDKRFSAFYAKIDFLGKKETIESIYQLSKRFRLYTPNSILEAKGKKADYYCIRGVDFPASYQKIFYQTLWVLYFKTNIDLYNYACEFDDFHDLFKGSSKVNQEDTIRHIVNTGLNQATKECYKFMNELYTKWKSNKNRI